MSNKLFTTIPVPRFPSNTFSLSRSVMFNPRLQKLYAPNIIETIPGDGFNERSEQFARTQPMVAPVFAKMNADQHAFFVPCWQLNEHFDEFITGGEDGMYQDKMPYMYVKDIFTIIQNIFTYEDDFLTDNPSTPVSQVRAVMENIQNIIEHCDLLRAVPFLLPDFLEIPNNNDKYNIFISNQDAFFDVNEDRLSDSTLRVNLLPFGAYLKVWNEFFRDENLCEDTWKSIWKDNQYGDVSLYYATGYVDPSDICNLADVGGDPLNYANFWAALLGVLPRAWKKDYFTAALPFTQKGPEVLLPLSGVFPVEFSGTTTPDPTSAVQWNGAGQNLFQAVEGGGTTPITANTSLNASGLGSTIQDLRRAVALEQFYEADGRGGNRYPENTLVQFGVRTPDSRLPRAQFLGSNTSPISISEVVQNSSTADQPTPQGTLAGKGISYGNNRLCRQYITMHGFLINLYSVRTQAIYESGVHPMFSRFDRTEYAWPRFAHLGEQPVYVKEMFVDDTVTEDEVFGYEPRYSEYKSEKSSVHHLLKGSLNYWTMSRRFSDKPQLSEEFIYNAPRLDAFAVVNPLQSPLIVEIDYRVRANRKLPFFGVPSI